MIKNEPVHASQNRLLILKGILLAISMFLSVFAFFFFIWKQNFSASSSCLTLEIVCVLFLHLTSTVMRGQLHMRYNHTRLKFLFILSIVIGVAEFMAVISFAALGAMNHQDFQLEGYGYYVAIIPSSLACLWSFILAYESRSYMGEFNMVGTNMAQY